MSQRKNYGEILKLLALYFLQHEELFPKRCSKPFKLRLLLTWKYLDDIDFENTKTWKKHIPLTNITDASLISIATFLSVEQNLFFWQFSIVLPTFQFFGSKFQGWQKFPEGGRLKCHTCWILTSFYSKICNNSFVKIMFNEYKYVLCIKKSLGFLFFQDKVKKNHFNFLLEIHNHSRHTFSQYSKEGKRY